MGKNFQFPLQKVLEYRATVEDAKAYELNQSKNQLRNEEEIMENLQTQKGSIFDNLPNEKSMSIHQLQVSSNYINQLNNQIKNQGKSLEKVTGIVEKDREKLMEASRDKKAVELLKEKKKTAFDKDMKIRETKMYDDIAMRGTLNNDEADL